MKKQLLWVIWLILSLLWFVGYALYMLIILPKDLHTLAYNPFFMIGLIMSIVNLWVCVSIGTTLDNK